MSGPMQPLDGSRFKVARAREHLGSLTSEIKKYLDEQPRVVHSTIDMRMHPGDRLSQEYASYYAPRGNTFLLQPIIASVPPMRLSAIIGDCVTNATASLDYIVWELAQRYFRPPLDERRDLRLTHFPIDPKRKPEKQRTFLQDLQNRGIPDEAIAEIRAALPHMPGYEPLGWLHTLVNRDKHRMPLLTVGEFDVKVTFRTPGIFADLKNEPATITFPSASFATNQAPMQSDMPMKGDVAVYVTWPDELPVARNPVEVTLQQIVDTVSLLIPKFERFL